MSRDIAGEMEGMMATSVAVVPVPPHPIAHAKLGASSAKRWMNCPGCLRMSAGVPDQPSVYAEEGTAAHSVASSCLVEGHEAIEFLERSIEVAKGRSYVCDEDMVDAVQLYLDTIHSYYDPTAGDKLFVETRFSLADLDPPADMFGTADCVIYKPYSRLLIVVDFKYGAGVIVDAKDNAQGRYYGVGAALQLRELPVTDIMIVIVQPRAASALGPVRSETISAGDLHEWLAELMDMARETQKPDAPLHAGEWCRFCPAIEFCHEHRRAAIEAAQAEFNDEGDLTKMPPAPESLNAEQIAKLLDGLYLLEEWSRSFKRYAFEIMKHGATLPGWKLVERRGRRRWVSENEAEVAAQVMVTLDLSEDQVYERKLKSPPKIEKLVRKKRMAEIADLVEKRSSGVTLARASDERPAVEASAAMEFIEPPSNDTD